MILGGTFARHPGLKLVLTEQWIDWAPQVMRDMDGLFDGPNGISLRESLGKPPRPLPADCYFGASFLSNWEAKFAIEHDLVGNTMWVTTPAPGGHLAHTRADGPHVLRHRAQHVAQFLGDVAIDVYHLDRGRLGSRRPDRPPSPTSRSGAVRPRATPGLRLPLRGELHLMGDTVNGPPCRDVTADEIEHLHEHGWVKLAAFVDADAVARVLEVAREQMGDDGDGNPLHPSSRRRRRGGAGVRYFNAHSPGGLGNPCCVR